MNILSKKLLQHLKPVLGDIRAWIIVSFLGWLFSTGILLAKNRAWNGLQKPIPLWIVIVISLSILFGCAILFLFHSYRSSKASDPQIVFFEIGNLKWRTTVYKSGYFDVENTPYCLIHDQKLRYDDGNYFCFGHIGKEKCRARVMKSDSFQVKQFVNSTIEKRVRNRDY